jgi:ATP-dependent Zn protease
MIITQASLGSWAGRVVAARPLLPQHEEGWLWSRTFRKLPNTMRGEVKLIVSARALNRAKDLVTTNIGTLHETAAVLMEQENIDGEEFQTIGSGREYLRVNRPRIPYQ